MAENKNINSLESLEELTGTESFVIGKENETKKLSINNLKNYLVAPIIIDEISFYELLKFSEDQTNYNFTEVTDEMIDSIYTKAKNAVELNRCLLISYAPKDIEIESRYFELDKVILDNEASLGTIINNFVYSIYINKETHKIEVKTLNNTSINLKDLNERINSKVDSEEGKGLSTNDYTNEDKEALGNKVDKVEGKQLSTEDFTTLLKEKLEGLENYNDTEVVSSISNLTNTINTLIENNDVEGVINSFNEIEQFLQGITNTKTLTGLLNELENKIIQLCDDTYLPLSGGIIENGNSITPLIIKSNHANSVGEYFSLTDGNKAWVGYVNNQGACIYNQESKKYLGIKDDGTPHFEGNKLFHEGNDGSGSGLDADTLDGYHANDFMNVGFCDTNDINDLLKAGSYRFGITPSNSPIESLLSHGNILVVRGNGDTLAQLCFPYNQNKAWLRNGNETSIKTNPWHEFAFTDSNVASADKLTTKQLTNEDLNNILDYNFSTYFAHSTNTCANKPTGVTTFGLQVINVGASHLVQICIAANINAIFTRKFNNSSWGSWKKLLTEDDESLAAEQDIKNIFK